MRPVSGLGPLALVLAAALWPAVAAAQAYRFPFGGGCTAASCYITAYYDEDGGGGLRDWGCGALTYDGHRGTDIGVGGWAGMDAGRDIVAAAEGTVIATHDGEFDRCTTADCPGGGGYGNYVALRHPDGRTSYYGHMKKFTVAVSVGQNVTCGQKLGQVGSSGHATGPHLHFEPRSGNVARDPFAGGCSPGPSLWVDQGPYKGLPAPRCAVIDGDGDGYPPGADCNDGDPAVHPGAPEQCNNRDDDCDGAVDEDLRRDCGADVGECRRGTESCQGGAWGRCSAVSPAPEQCDDRDNDCDGAVDNGGVCELEEAALGPLADQPGGSDVDGDGRADLCLRGPGGIECHLSSGRGFPRAVAGPALSDEAGFSELSRYATLRMGDLDGDGRADLCARGPDGIACWLAPSLSRRVPGPELSDAAGYGAPRYFATLRLADVTGDGRADLCARGEDGLRCWPSTGRGFGAPLLLPALSDAAGWDRVERYGTLRLGDVNGDGRADVCGRDGEGLVCYLAGEGGFAAALRGPALPDAAGWGRVEHWSTLRLLDVDGDGRADLCGRGPGGFACWLFDGVGFSRAALGPALGPEEDWRRRGRYGSLRMGDVDGDGRADLCLRGAERLGCWLFDGRGFDRQIAGPALPDEAGWGEPRRFRTLRLADVDGDGRADLCGRDGEGVFCDHAGGDGFPRRFLGPRLDGAAWDRPAQLASLILGGGRAAAAGCALGGAGASPGAAALALLPLLALRRRARRRAADENGLKEG